MNFKEFYKFTWAKIILFILIIVIPLLFIMQESGIKDGPLVNPFWIYLTYILFWPFILIYFVESLIIPNIDWIHLIDIPFIVLAILINILYIYTIVSLIMILFKNKNKISSKSFKR